MSRWEPGSDVILVVTGKYSILGSTIGNQWEDGRVLVQWADMTRSRIMGDLLISPGDAVVVPTKDELVAERDRARDLAARLEAQLALIEEVVTPPMEDYRFVQERVFRIREILGVTS